MAADFFIIQRMAVNGGTDYAGTNNGTLNNSPGYTPAVAAQGFTFDGYNNVSIPDAPDLQICRA